MQEYYKISDIAALMGVTIKTLKYYDSIGLLTPDYRDEDTGYRYYSNYNINQLSYILVLKHCGLPLKEIAKYFDASYVPGTMINRLIQERDMLNRHIEKLQDFHLPPDASPIKQEFIPESLALHTRFLTDSAEDLSKSFQMLLQDAVKYKVQLASVYCYISEYDNTRFLKEPIYVDSYLEINHNHSVKNIPPDRLATLPSGRFVTSVLYGDYSGTNQVHRNISAYCMEHDLEITGFSRKYYLRHEGSGVKNASEYVTKIATPVR